jgi:hypothetical protein
MMRLSILFSVVLAGLVACSQEPEEQQAAPQPQPTGQAGSAEQVGRQIDQAVSEFKEKAKEAEGRLGDRLIEAGKAIKQE